MYENRLIILNCWTLIYFSTLQDLKTPVITSLYSSESGLLSMCLCLPLLRTTLTNCSKLLSMWAPELFLYPKLILMFSSYLFCKVILLLQCSFFTWESCRFISNKHSMYQMIISYDPVQKNKILANSFLSRFIQIPHLPLFINNESYSLKHLTTEMFWTFFFSSQKSELMHNSLFFLCMDDCA